MEYDTENLAIKMIERLADLQGQKVLEIGCGDGRMSRLIANKTLHYVAIDSDEQSIEKAKAEIPNVSFRVGSGEDMEFEDASFPVIIFTLSLHHQNSRLALKEAHRVLTANGQLIILEPVANAEVTQFFNLFEDETERVLDALNTIYNCDFRLEQRETFSVIMSFENLDELCDYPFGRSTIHPEDCERIIETLLQSQGQVDEMQPIHLRDYSHLFSLRKKDL